MKNKKKYKNGKCIMANSGNGKVFIIKRKEMEKRLVEKGYVFIDPEKKLFDY